MAEQRYEAVRAVIADGETVTDVAARFGVARKTVHAWQAKYEAGGLEGLGDRSHRPRSCPHQMPAAVEVALAELRRAHPSWGPRRLAFELGKGGVVPVPSESAAYRALVRLNLIDPAARRPRDRQWKRWERGAPMELRAALNGPSAEPASRRLAETFSPVAEAPGWPQIGKRSACGLLLARPGLSSLPGRLASREGDGTGRRSGMRNRKLEQLQRALADERSRRVVFLSHCILNENVRYLGGAGRRGGIDEVVDGFQAAGVGICQMPCPEQRAWGGVAKRYLVPVYGSEGTVRYRLRRPLTVIFLCRTRWVYARLARRVVRDIADYARSGFEVTGVMGVGASPSCGVFHTLDVPRSLEAIAGCQAASADARRFNTALMASARIDGEGYFIRALRRGLARRGLAIPFQEHDLAAELQAGPGVPADDEPGPTRAPAARAPATARTGSGRLRTQDHQVGVYAR